MATKIKKDQTNVDREIGLDEPIKLEPDEKLYDSHIVKELVKYVSGKPERLQYLRQCIIPFFDLLFFSENVEGGKDLVKVIILKEDEHV